MIFSHYYQFLFLTFMAIFDCHAHRSVHDHPGPVGRLELRYTGSPIYILLAFYYHCITLTSIYVYRYKLEINSFVISKQ